MSNERASTGIRNESRNYGTESWRGAVHCEWAALVTLVSSGGTVTGPATRSPVFWPEPCGTIMVDSHRLLN